MWESCLGWDKMKSLRCDIYYKAMTYIHFFFFLRSTLMSRAGPMVHLCWVRPLRRIGFQPQPMGSKERLFETFPCCFFFIFLDQRILSWYAQSGSADPSHKEQKICFFFWISESLRTPQRWAHSKCPSLCWLGCLLFWCLCSMLHVMGCKSFFFCYAPISQPDSLSYIVI